MNELFKLILKLSISGSIFFLVFQGLSFFTQKIFSAKWHLFILKLNMIVYFTPIVLIYDSFTKGSSSHNMNSINIAFNEIGKSNHSIKVIEYLVIIWILGVSIICCWNFYCYKRFIKSIKNSSYRDEELESAIYKCSKDLKIIKRITVRRSCINSSPMIIGVIKPIIIFPSNMDYSSKLEPVIIHELIHYRRKDSLFKMIQFGIMAINWFNPIVYIMNNVFEKWCEISCDEIVAENMSYAERKEYGETILNIIETLSVAPNSLYLHLCSDKNYIKRRLFMMLNNKKSNRFNKVLRIMVVGAIVLCSFGISIVTTATVAADEERVDNIVIDTNDDSIREMFEGRVEEMKNENNLIKSQGSMIVVDVETGEVLGTCKFNKL
ncbi:MAG: M56 family metallopeptidase [Clostridium sp.]